MKDQSLENPVMGYIVIAAALVVGMLSATVFGALPVTDGRVKSSHPTLVANAAQDAASPCVAGPEQRDGSVCRKLAATASEGISRRWVLGVRTTPTPTGCVVSSVITGSSAQRAGINAGDRIITLGGLQVGGLPQRSAPLADVVDESPHRSTSALVQRRRSRDVVLVEIQLQTPAECLGH